MAAPVKRISAEDAHERLESGDALLVCAYDEPEKFEQNHLEGAMSLDEFEEMEASVPWDREIIFYCA